MSNEQDQHPALIAIDRLHCEHVEMLSDLRPSMDELYFHEIMEIIEVEERWRIQRLVGPQKK